MGRKYIKPDHEPKAVAYAGDWWGWKCETCGGPLALSMWAANTLTGHRDNVDDADRRAGVAPFHHDTKSDFYWMEAA